MENLVQDLKYAARILIRQPVFTAVAVLSLASGSAPVTSLVLAVMAFGATLVPARRATSVPPILAIRYE